MESVSTHGRVRMDLHYHGPISFNPKMLKWQGYANIDRNPLALMADTAFERDIGVLAIVSEGKKIPIGSLDDRLGYMNSEFGRTLPREYSRDKLGNNVFVVERRADGKKLYLVNGQTVLVYDKDSDGKSKRFDHLVFGSNQVPNLWSFGDTINYCHDHGLPNFLEHPGATGHFGLGFERAEKLLEKHGKKITGVEGHNAQLRVPELLAFIPQIRAYSKAVTAAAETFAAQRGVPYIRTSDGHRIESAGLSYVEAPEPELRTGSDEELIGSVRHIIESQKYSIGPPRFEPILSWINWVAKFKLGEMMGVYDKWYQQDVTPENMVEAQKKLKEYKKIRNK